ncbi:MAG TPA: winged helix-turn-helix domain-containing protein [Candidatus Dormibacteraeota bacterium]|nr:winged helix-turn-helix domain-containing protein [Candidatus Dormibacteraeota bacterium]
MTREASPTKGVVRFGIYQCDFRAGELRKNGIKVRLSDQPFRLLTVLLERRGELVTRQELREELWPDDEFGEFNDGLNTAINKVRAALDDSAENPRFIETVPRRGYRFIAPVEAETAVEAAEPVTASASVALGIPAASAEAKLIAPRAFSRRRKAAWIGASFATVAVLGAIAGFLWWPLHEHNSTAGGARIESIAVLPFDDFSTDASQRYFADGMTEELITDLGELGSLRVTSRASVMRYRGAQKPIREIREELGVDAVVEGSVVRSGKSVRVDARLVDTSDDRQIWAESFTRNEQDVIALQDDIARAVAQRVEVAINPSVRARLRNARPVNAQAYEAYLHGITYLAHHSDADLLRSLDYFKQATAIDPTMAVAYAAEARAYCYLGDYSVLPDRVVWPQAEMAAERAMALDDSIAEAHATRAFALWRYEWNWSEADAEFRKALALGPNDSDTHHLYGIFLATRQDFAGAEQQLRIARGLDPLSLIIRTNLGWLSYYRRDYTTAIADYRSVLQSDGMFLPAHEKLWIAYALQGDTKDAANEVEDVFRLYHHEELPDGALAAAERGDPAARFRAELLAYANSGDLTWYEKARYFAVAGRKREALKSLQEALRARESWLVYAAIEPAFDSLRSSPEFQQILAAVNAPE